MIGLPQNEDVAGKRRRAISLKGGIRAEVNIDSISCEHRDIHMQIDISANLLASPDVGPFEVVERKGLGHPDTLCDAIAERASVEYSRFCLAKFGKLAHHWFDKLVLSGGEANIGFGYGELTQPYCLTFYGKAARAVGEVPIPLGDIFRKAAEAILTERLIGFDPKRNLQIIDRTVDHQGTGNLNSRYRPKSIDDLIDLDEPSRHSNDCNLCVGYAPLTDLERLVLELERWMFSAEFRADWPDGGTDIKIVGIRRGESFSTLISFPFLGRKIPSQEVYDSRLAELTRALGEKAQAIVGVEVSVAVNQSDHRAYLNALGSSADTGDVGVVGRGNRIIGLITPMRPMSIEATNGKNPTDHTGKLYGVAAQRLSEAVYAATARPNQVHLITLKGRRIGSPVQASVAYAGEPDDALEVEMRRLVDAHLEAIGSLTADFVREGVVMY